MTANNNNNQTNEYENTSSEYYLDPQNNFRTHGSVVNDQIVMDKFSGWINNNQNLFKNKVVLDVGCGCGIFSMMAAKAGASSVISIEWTNIIDDTRQIIKENCLDNIIKVVEGKVDNITELPLGINNVDIIISFWMGHSLFVGERLLQVIKARDKWLNKKSGIIIPDVAELYVSAISDENFKEKKIDWWKNVYGYDMSCVADEFLKYTQYCNVSEDKVVTNACPIWGFNLMEITIDEVYRERRFRLTAKRDDFIQGFITYFTIKMSLDQCVSVLNTSPLSPRTYFGQSCFYIKDCILIKRKEKLVGRFKILKQARGDPYSYAQISVEFQSELTTRNDQLHFMLKP